MIIFGTKGVNSTSKSGQFNCPTCGQTRPFKQKKVRTFIHIYWIPLIPIENHGEFVECGFCKTTFKPEVLSWNPEEDNKRFQAEYQEAIKKAMLIMMMADGIIRDEEVDEVREFYLQVSGISLNNTEIRQEGKILADSGHGVKSYLKKVSGQLSESGKAIIVKAAYYVAVADGELHQNEKMVLADLAEVLNISGALFKEILDEIKASHPSNQQEAWGRPDQTQ